jgi:hypothetical protein
VGASEAHFYFRYISNDSSLSTIFSFIKIFPAAFTSSPSFEDFKISGIIIIILGIIIITPVEEFYYRGICLPALIHSRWKKHDNLDSRIMNDKGNKRKNKKNFVNNDNSGNIYFKIHSKIASFFRDSAWLLNAILTSLSFSLLNPWNTISRIAAFFPIINFVQKNANMCLGLQVSWMLAIADGIHLIVSSYWNQN